MVRYRPRRVILEVTELNRNSVLYHAVVAMHQMGHTVEDACYSLSEVVFRSPDTIRVIYGRMRSVKMTDHLDRNSVKMTGKVVCRNYNAGQRKLHATR